MESKERMLENDSPGKIKILERYVSVDPSMIDSVMEMAIDKLFHF